MNQLPAHKTAFSDQTKPINLANDSQPQKVIVVEISLRAGVYFLPCVIWRQIGITDLFIQNRLIHNVITDEFIIFKSKENNEGVGGNRV